MEDCFEEISQNTEIRKVEGAILKFPQIQLFSISIFHKATHYDNIVNDSDSIEITVLISICSEVILRSIEENMGDRKPAAGENFFGIILRSIEENLGARKPAAGENFLG